MTKVLLSIKPEFVSKIFDGTKKYEFRKVLFKEKDVSTIVVYSSSPICQVVGEFNVDEILCDNAESIWENTKDHAGVTKEFYSTYFNGRKTAIAIKIGRIKKYRYPKKLSDLNVKKAPQSFCYLDK